MGEGGCQNWPHLNSSGTSLLPRSPLDVAASVQCVEAATGCISSLVASPRGPQSYPVALFTIFQLHDAQTLFFSATQYFSAI